MKIRVHRVFFKGINIYRREGKEASTGELGEVELWYSLNESLGSPHREL